MKNKNTALFCLSFFIFFLHLLTAPLKAQTELGWFQLQSGTNLSLTSVYFIDLNTGWVCGSSGVIRKTTDGGLSWIPLNSATTYTLYSIRFINSSTGWVVGAGGTLKYTTNGGTNWLTRSSGTVYPLYSIQFINQSTAWIGGYGGRIMQTTNSGTNWSVQTTPVFTDIFSLFFLSPQRGWSVGYVGTIIKTTNGGANWSNLSIGNTTFNAVHFLDTLRGWIIGSGGAIRFTTNGGNSWITQSASTTANFYALYFTPTGNPGWIGGSSGVIKYSTNLGTSWITQPSTTTGQIEEFFFINNTTGWAACSGGIILKTYTGGVITGVSTNENFPAMYLLEQNYPNPFNPITKIKFDIPPLKGARGMTARLMVYDILGREITALVNKQLKPGKYEVEWNGSNCPSGVYFYKLITEEFTDTKTMVLVK